MGRQQDMIDDDIAGFIEGSVMTILASRDEAMRAEIARAVGTRRLSGNDLFDSFVSRAQWPDFAQNLAADAPLALTFVRPIDYRAYQIKAQVAGAAPVCEEEATFVRGYIRDMGTDLAALGVSARQRAAWFCDRELLRIRYRPLAIFRQTPGPAAGTALAGGRA